LSEAVAPSREHAVPRSGAPDVAAQRERYARAGQAQVFAFAEGLEPAARERLARQALGFDPAAVTRDFAAARARAAAPERLEPPDVLRLPERGGDPAERERARVRGEALLAEGAVGVLVVAGGQGTRLGFPGPKGAFPLGPVTGRSLFAQQAQKLHAARRRCGRPLPWLLMTSDATDAATRALFEAERCFGLPPGDVRFFVQGLLPNVDREGRILLEARDRIAASPDGHGGVLEALAAAGLLDWLDARGVTRLSYSQVDNPLVPLADPVFLGLHELARAEMSAKVLAKRTPDERAGTVGRRGDRVHVREYTELDPWHRDERGPDGELAFWAGSIAIHVLNVDFARRVAADAGRLLPCHASLKVIPTVDAGGRPLVPDAPNGYKLERFVFDALPEARRAALLEVRRAEEYSPIKNRTGGESPRTAREDLVACYHRWLDAAGVAGVPGDAWIELDQSRVDGPDDLRAAGVRGVGPETDWIRLGSRGNT
jgi:UDP-N-acetylglucosamine/UDP-N-acetylgalactosamine diphosphorylase